jgi:ribosomal protein S27AE
MGEFFVEISTSHTGREYLPLVMTDCTNCGSTHINRTLLPNHKSEIECRECNHTETIDDPETR